MDIKTIIQKKSEVITKYGPWTAHNIQLRDDIYTIAPEIIGDEVKLRRIVQCVLDLVGGSVEGLRILDLACLEGLYAIEFARHKATCLGIEGREANVEKARFAKQVLLLDNLEFTQDDVRNPTIEKHGQFDVVLCLGISVSPRCSRCVLFRGESRRNLPQNMHCRHKDYPSSEDLVYL